MASNVLREFITQIILEAKKTSVDAESLGAAMFVMPRGDETLITIYRPDFYFEVLENTRQYVHDLTGGKKNSPRAPSKKIFDGILKREGGIVGMLSFSDPQGGECWDAKQVALAAANQGYGPLLYEIALDLIPSHTITPDRVAVSPQAFNVWRKFYHERGDIRKKRFTSKIIGQKNVEKSNCQLHPPERHELNYAYEGHPNVNVNKLERNHVNFILKLRELASEIGYQPISSNDIEDGIEFAAEIFFAKKYAKQAGLAYDPSVHDPI